MDVVDLSIDFDFFVREDPLWDFGHHESMLHQVLWPVRYRTTKLYEETELETFADFMPGQTLMALTNRNLHLKAPGTGRADQNRRIGVADSHRHALEFLDRFPPADRLISLDAHHDLFNDNELDCSNWLAHLMDRWQDTETTVVYPGWKEMELDGPPVRSIQQTRWENWNPPGGRIRHIFLCRSGAWVPPHHDKQFLELVKLLAPWGQIEELEPLLDRQDITPSRQEAQKAYQKFQKQYAPRQQQQGQSR